MSMVDFIKEQTENHQLRARRALLLFNNVHLRIRRVLSLYYGDSTLLVFNRTLLNNYLTITPVWLSNEKLTV